MTIAIHRLIDDAKCYEMVRDLRWPNGIGCPHCESLQVVKNGHDTFEVCRQRYICRDCDRSFDDLTNTVFALASSAVTDMDAVFLFHGA